KKTTRKKKAGPVESALPPIASHLQVVIDRFVVQPGDESNRSRMADSVQTAFFEGHGDCSLEVMNEKSGGVFRQFSNRFEA
ncbi:hypothetical protein LNY03_29200, partial [Pseudomonas nitroreducens]|uniref:hypothetical protein n=1 Tax=Pseudomonas nitroreducens TaxID=46680 RepID=UPI001FB7A4EE